VTKESLLSARWIKENNTVQIEAGVMR